MKPLAERLLEVEHDDGCELNRHYGYACINLQRRFIGIEIDQRHFDRACVRIENALRQERLFA